MSNNAAIISHDDETIRTSDFKGMGERRLRADGGRAGFLLEARQAGAFARPSRGRTISPTWTRRTERQIDLLP